MADPTKAQTPIETEQLISCRNYATMIAFAKEHRPDLNINTLCAGIPTTIEHLTNIHNFVDWSVAREFVLKFKDAMGIERPSQMMDVSTTLSKYQTAGPVETLARRIGSTGLLIRGTRRYNWQWNTVCDMIPRNIKKTTGTVVVFFKNRVFTNGLYDLCRWNAGLFKALPHASNMPTASLTERICRWSPQQILLESGFPHARTVVTPAGEFLIDGKPYGHQVFLKGEDFMALFGPKHIKENQFMPNGIILTQRELDSDYPRISLHNEEAYSDTAAIQIDRDFCYQDGEPLLFCGQVYGGPCCIYDLSWKNRSFLGRVVNYMRTSIISDSNQIAQLEDLLDASNTANQELITKMAQMKTAHERLVKYVHPSVVSSIMDRGMDVPLEMQSTYGAVVFSDIRGFTTLSEQLKKDGPTALSSFLREYMTAIHPAIDAHNGWVDKVMGDGLMVIYDTPEQAILSGIEQLGALRQFNLSRSGDVTGSQTLHIPEYKTKSLPGQAQASYAIRIGLGMTWGEIAIGSIGVPSRKHFTVLGEPVNTASRLEDLTKQFQVPFIISGSAVASLADRRCLGDYDIGPVTPATRTDCMGELLEKLNAGQIFVRYLGMVLPKGKVNPVLAYEVLNPYDTDKLLLILGQKSAYEQAMELYHRYDQKSTVSPADQAIQNLTEARRIFEELEVGYVRNWEELCHSTLPSQFALSPAGYDPVYRNKIEKIDGLLKDILVRPDYYNEHPWTGLTVFDEK